MSLLTMGIISTIFVLMLLALFLKLPEVLKNIFMFIGAIGFIFIVCLGFGIYATINTKNIMIEEVKKDTVIRYNKTLYVELVNGHTLQYDSKLAFDLIDNSTKFYIVKHYNYYNSEKSSEGYYITNNCDELKEIEINKKIEPIKFKNRLK